MQNGNTDDRENFFNSLNQDLLQVFDEEPSLDDPQLRFPLHHKALNDEPGSYPVKLLGLIGSGGMKDVYKCEVQDDDKVLALAIMKNKGRNRDKAVEEFLREAEMTQKLDHYNIIRVYDYGVNERYGPYMAMNYVEGESLSNVLTRLSSNNAKAIKDYPLERFLKMFKDIVSAVQYAHSQGVVHLDLKPENILIDLQGRVYICDWGLARVLPEYENDDNVLYNLNDCSQSHTFVKGSPGFMAPEQVSLKDAGVQTDIYQLGGILYAMIFLKAPIEGENVDEVLEKTLSGQIEIPKSCNYRILKILKTALSTKPEERFKSVDEMRENVNNISNVYNTGALGCESKNEKTIVLIAWLLGTVLAVIIGAIILQIVFASERRTPLEMDVPSTNKQ